MWSQNVRSVALERAQALLSAQSSPGGGRGPGQPAGPARRQPAGPSLGHTGAVGVSDLSDVSWLSSGHGSDSQDSSAVEAAAGRTRSEEEGRARDLRPQNSLGGGGSRFLKKARPPAATSIQSPVSKSQTQIPSETRSSLRGSQAAALSRLAQIESRIRSHKQVGQGPKPETENMATDMGMLPPSPITPALVTSEHLSARSSSEQSLRGKRFLKSRATAAGNSRDDIDGAAAAAGAPPVLKVGVRSRARAADTVGAVSVSLESDEEDMRKLLGDSPDSTDNLTAWRHSSVLKADKVLNRSNERIRSTPPPPLLANQAPPQPPTPPSHRSSPFRFTGQAQAHFSPSVLSPTTSSSPGGCKEQHSRTVSPQHSLSSMSGHSEVLSLEELFPVRPGSKEPHSDISTVISDDFHINVLTLDDLGYTEEIPTRQRETKEEDQKQRELEAEPDYQSDFESESRTEPGDSVSQVSEVREEATHSELSHRRTESDYSSTISDTSSTNDSLSSDHRKMDRRRSRSSTSSQSCVSDGAGASQQSGRRSSSPHITKEAATQTQPELRRPHTPPVGLATGYMAPSPLVTHTLNAETVEALSTFNPALFAFNELLKQQLASTLRFIESSRDVHSRLLQSLEPPSYRYTTLAGTMECIRKRGSPRPAKKEVMSLRQTHT